MKRWYKDLEGKEVIYIGYQASYYCIVTGFDYDFGITLQEKTTGRYMYCYRGPSAKVPNYQSAKRDFRHRKFMTYMAKCVKEGRIVKKEREALLRKLHNISPFFSISYSNPSTNTCAFSQ